MDTTRLYSSKAEKYAKYRWDYAPQAIQTIFEVSQISEEASVADIGAGTGILSRHFAAKGAHVFAIEPNPAMRELAVKVLALYPSCQVMEGTAETTRLAAESIDLIAVAQAIHWFEPEPARAEFVRILKPGGWLALLRNYNADNRLIEAMAEILTAENGFDVSGEARPPAGKPVSFYYGHEVFLKLDFPFSQQTTWEEFIGSWASAAPAPDEGQPLYPKFEQALRSVFDRFSSDGLLAVHGVTELFLGQVEAVSLLNDEGSENNPVMLAPAG
jgi:SAM-dependent methyltransferase